jgi:hypothetical protein
MDPAMAIGQDIKPSPASAPRRPSLAAGQRETRFAEIVRKAYRDPLLLAFSAGAVIARIAFWVISNRMFEDGLITITHARNVPLGLGLVHHVGEGPVHGFTSALSVLIPLAGELIHEGNGLLAIRLASLVAACVALLYARLICRDLGIGVFPASFVLAYLAFDQNMIFYGMSGMETQVAVAVILGGTYHVVRRDFMGAGIWLGLAPLARPEFVLWVAPALTFLAIVNVKRTLVTAGIASAIIAPWVVFTTAYYGSPIPNTIIAKATITPTPAIISDGSALPWLNWLGMQTIGHLVSLIYHLEPFKEVWNTVAAPIPSPLLAVIGIVMVYFLVLGLIASRSQRNLWPVLAFLGLFFAYRIYFIPVILYYEWYLPPFLAVVMIVVALGIQRMSTTIHVAPKAAAVALGIAFAIHMPFSFIVESKIQSVENQVRTNVALYLKTNVQPGQSVFSESSGYIGYYSDVKLYDYPGLTSKVSVRALQALPPAHRQIPDLVAALQPDWLVMRPWELDSLRQEFPDVAAEYQIEKVFEMPGIPDGDLNVQGATGVAFGGLVVADTDMKFTVLKRLTT